MFDIWSNQNHFIKLGKIKTDACLSCGSNRTYPYLSYENQTKAAVLCGRNTVQIRTVDNRKYNFDDIEKVLQKLGKVDRNPYLLSCQFDDYRVVVFEMVVFLFMVQMIFRKRNNYIIAYSVNREGVNNGKKSANYG